MITATRIAGFASVNAGGGADLPHERSEDWATWVTPDPMTAPVSKQQRTRKTILVVDDEEMLRLLVTLTLERSDYGVLTAANGEEGIELARSEQPDLVLLDVTMPVMDGLEACRRLKADPATSAIPVVMLTARAGDEDRAAGLAAGADDYLLKPFRPGEFIAYLSKRLGPND